MLVLFTTISVTVAKLVIARLISQHNNGKLRIKNNPIRDAWKFSDERENAFITMRIVLSGGSGGLMSRARA
jgi:hypothetical protein